MKAIAIVVLVSVGLAVVFAAGMFADHTLAPLLFNSRIERLPGKNLPKIMVQGDTVYCRMKADDFRFPLPPGSRVVKPVVTGGFDTVEGSLEIRFDGTNRFTADDYLVFLSGKVQVGGHVTAVPIP